MSASPSVVYFVCDDLDKDPVGPRVYEALAEKHEPEPAGFEVDGRPVLLARLSTGVDALIVRTADVISHDYPRYLPLMEERFGDAELACVINWHAGENAPERVLTAHSNGDIDSGTWGASNPRHLRNLLLGLERERLAEGLEDFSVVVEGTHWSGIPYGGNPALAADPPMPVYDVEIGSEPSSWSSAAAARAIAGAVESVLDEPAETHLVSVLAGGGVHCETGFSDPVLGAPADHAVALSHILPNHWLVSGEYDTEAADAKLDACVASIVGGVDVIAVHRKLKGSYKEAFRRLGERLGVPVVNHRALARPEELV
jgi:D-tyrosyl-tRNA(Tyr) deacylase